MHDNKPGEATTGIRDGQRGGSDVVEQVHKRPHEQKSAVIVLNVSKGNVCEIRCFTVLMILVQP